MIEFLVPWEVIKLSDRQLSENAIFSRKEIERNLEIAKKVTVK